MADMEMIFPEKKVYIKPFILIQLVVTVVLAVFTILSTLVQVCTSSTCHHAMPNCIVTDILHRDVLLDRHLRYWMKYYFVIKRDWKMDSSVSASCCACHNLPACFSHSCLFSVGMSQHPHHLHCL